MGGSGSLMHMNISMKQNRANKTSNKQKFRANDGGKIHSNKHTKALQFKEVSKEELEKIKSNIREKLRKDRRTFITTFIVTAVLVVALMLIIFN